MASKHRRRVRPPRQGPAWCNSATQAVNLLHSAERDRGSWAPFAPRTPPATWTHPRPGVRGRGMHWRGTGRPPALHVPQPRTPQLSISPSRTPAEAWRSSPGRRPGRLAPWLRTSLGTNSLRSHSDAPLNYRGRSAGPGLRQHPGPLHRAGRTRTVDLVKSRRAIPSAAVAVGGPGEGTRRSRA